MKKRLKALGILAVGFTAGMLAILYIVIGCLWWSLGWCAAKLEDGFDFVTGCIAERLEQWMSKLKADP